MSDAAARRARAHRGLPAIGSTEQRSLESVAHRLERLRGFLDAHPIPTPEQNAAEWFNFLNGIKRLLGNLNHSLDLTAMLLVKEYLTTKHSDVEFDTAGKSWGAPGLDIDVMTRAGQRIVAAVKTMSPRHENDFGSQQKSAVLRDFAKLAAAPAEHKYLFLTAPEAFAVIWRRYRERVEGVVVVSVADGREFLG